MRWKFIFRVSRDNSLAQGLRRRRGFHLIRGGTPHPARFAAHLPLKGEGIGDPRPSKGKALGPAPLRGEGIGEDCRLGWRFQGSPVQTRRRRFLTKRLPLSPLRAFRRKRSARRKPGALLFISRPRRWRREDRRILQRREDPDWLSGWRRWCGTGSPPVRRGSSPDR